MKRTAALILTAVLSLSLAACGSADPEAPSSALSFDEPSSAPVSSAEQTASLEDPAPASLYAAARSELEEQAAIDQDLLAEAEAGYSIDDPLVVVNPYGNVPLSAMVIFDTDSDTEVSLTVKGHSEKDDIKTTFQAGKRHILPVLGLYAGQETAVELKLSDGTSKTLSIATDPVADNLAKGEVIKLDADFYDYSQLTFTYFTKVSGIMAYDSEGDLRYFAQIPAIPMTRLSNGRYAAYTSESPADDVTNTSYTGIIEFDLCGRVYNQYDLPGGAHHDIVELPNGNLLVGTSHDDRSVVNDRVVELERGTGAIVWDLDLCKLLDKTDGAGVDQTESNWFHNNSIWYDQATDSVLLSGRQVDAIVSVNKSTQELNWILGTPEGWTNTDPSLFFKSDGQDGSFEWQFAQHNVSILPDEDNNPATMDILLFDNGCGRVKKTNQEEALAGKDLYSRAVIYHIDTNAMTISQAWEYGKERGDSWYSSYISGARYDEAANAFWLCAGGIRYDPATGSYDVSMFGENRPEVVEEITLVDAVVGNELKYELKLNHASFRCARAGLYDTQSPPLDLTIPGNRFVIG